MLIIIDTRHTTQQQYFSTFSCMRARAGTLSRHTHHEGEHGGVGAHSGGACPD